MKYLLIPIWNYILKPILLLSEKIGRILYVVFSFPFFWFFNMILIVWHFSFKNLIDISEIYEIEYKRHKHKRCYYKNALDFILKRNLIKEKFSDNDYYYSVDDYYIINQIDKIKIGSDPGCDIFISKHKYKSGLLRIRKKLI